MFTWSLTLATRDRPEMLCRCVEAALRQSRPPVEIVICDSSDGWQRTRDRVAALIGLISPPTRLWYGPSPRPQQTVQRNIAVAHATADVLFMIDDDSILRRDAAERVMAVYEQFGDAVGAVGIGAMQRWGGFDVSTDTPAMFRRDRDPLRRLALWIYGAFFFAVPIRVRHWIARLPAGLRNVVCVEGFQLTARRSLAQRCRFDEHLVTGHFEDVDATYRFSREAAVLALDRPLLFHAVAARPPAERRRGRFARFGWILNIAYLNRKYFGGSAFVRLFCWTHWLRCLAADLLRADGPRLRGCLDALAALWALTLAPQTRIGHVVESFSAALFSRTVTTIPRRRAKLLPARQRREAA